MKPIKRHGMAALRNFERQDILGGAVCSNSHDFHRDFFKLYFHGRSRLGQRVHYIHPENKRKEGAV